MPQCVFKQGCFAKTICKYSLQLFKIIYFFWSLVQCKQVSLTHQMKSLLKMNRLQFRYHGYPCHEWIVLSFLVYVLFQVGDTTHLLEIIFVSTSTSFSVLKSKRISQTISIGTQFWKPCWWATGKGTYVYSSALQLHIHRSTLLIYLS